MPKVKCRKYLTDLQNLTKGDIPLTEIAKNFIIAGISKQQDEKKLANSISNRIYNDGYFSDEEIKILDKVYKSNENLIPQDDTELIELEHIHINPSCGYGTIVMDEPDITPVKLGKKMIETILKVSDPNNLKTFTASGDSMEDTIDDGNILLVDIGRTDFNNGGIFVITINNDWFVKRLRKRLSGELDIISDNQSKYPIETYKPEDNIEIVVKGRVIKNLSKGL